MDDFLDNIEVQYKETDNFCNYSFDIMKNIIDGCEKAKETGDVESQNPNQPLSLKPPVRKNTPLSDDFLENPTSSFLDSFMGDFKKLTDNKEFVEGVVGKLDELHTVEEWIEILDPKEDFHVYTQKIDKILEEIELREDFGKYIVEMEKLREILRYNSKILNTC